jgi:ATP-dependent exoDNAse (exonuclease V) beta subunit
LATPNYLNSLLPANDGEVQLMTLHKSKGLEFDIVFHLNLHQWILPQYKGDYNQDLNLHYVGLTRARKSCILCISKFRHQNKTKKIASDSEFLFLNDLKNWRLPCPL